MKKDPEMDYRKRIVDYVDSLTGEILATSRYIHENPEIGEKEYKASAHLVEILESRGFSVTRTVGGMETAFKAGCKGCGKGPRIAFLAEYDALGSLGHACGHNFIAAASTFAGIALSPVMGELEGEIMVVGTPAEENLGGKVILLEQGVFEDVDAALMVHPSNETRIVARTLAAQAWEFEFRGKPAHAAAMPWKGRNALDALIQMFLSVDQMRKQQSPSVRTPGIITCGGEKPNIVPERSVGQFSCRGGSCEELLDVIERVHRCAEGAATATGTTVQSRAIQKMYKDIVPNHTMAGLFEKNWRDLGGDIDETPDKGKGSLDIGNLSHEFPCIHPFVQIAPPHVANHTSEFAEFAIGATAEKQIVRSVKALALTALDILLEARILDDMKREFQSQKEGI